QQPSRPRVGRAVFAVLAACALIAGAWAMRPQAATVTPPPPPDPLGAEVARTVKELEVKIDQGPVASIDALLAAEASFPHRAEWVATRGRVNAALRKEIARQVAASDVEGAEQTLAQLVRLGALPDDDALVTATRKAAFASRNGMVRVGEVYVDRYEYPNRAGGVPATKVDWADAVALCTGVGKHLCTEQEWELVCRSGGGAFPYGATFEKARCATKDPKRRGPSKSGERALCATSEGVFDLSGNVAEWTASPLREGAPQRVIRGGSFKQKGEQVSCQARDYLLPGLGGAPHLGLRCCL
ncbi:MAG: SUMF1/EgtB/PvdO family nonheme iron enzyme, partial [Archangium sp.]|nr:SUMF1/EgtB/PvdO family nonheme iron enzyme [Archangium sp.]